jgi:arylsulfatase A-like enzyme
VEESEVTLAEMLKLHGYSTAAFIGGFPLEKRFGLDQGFDFYDDDFGEKPPFFIPRKNGMWQGHKVTSFERRANTVIDASLDWIRSHNEKKLFLFLHLFDPHTPYSPPEPFDSDYDNEPYSGEIAFVDSCLGLFFSELDKLINLENTLVVITSDHGESLGEHGYYEHGHKLYEPSLAIPLIFWFPAKLPQSKIVNGLYRTVDIMPAILELLEIPIEHEIDGMSFVSSIFSANSDNNNRASYSETLMPQLKENGAALYAYRTSQWKYIRSKKDGQIVFEEIYNLEEDAKENNNLSSVHSSKMKELSLELDKILASNEGKGIRKKTSLNMDNETREKLRSLGYIK